MNIYDEILNKIAGSDLQIEGTIFQDVFYFIVGMEKGVEHPGVPFYSSLKHHFYLMDQIDQDEMGENSIPDFCDSMVANIESRYIETLRDGGNLNEITNHRDFLNSYWSYKFWAVREKKKLSLEFKALPPAISEGVITSEGVYQLTSNHQSEIVSSKVSEPVTAHALFFLYYSDALYSTANREGLEAYAKSAGLALESFRVTCYNMRPRYKAVKDKSFEFKKISKKTFLGAIKLAKEEYTICQAIEKDMKRRFD